MAALMSVAAAWEHTTEHEYQSAIQSNEVVVVALSFSASNYWLDLQLSHGPSEKSKQLEIEWYTSIQEARVPLISINCAAYPEICESYGFTKPPAVKVYRQGKEISTYKGPRRGSAILAWIDRVQRPAVTELDKSSLEPFKRADETVFIAYLSADDEAAKTAFAQVAAEFSEEFTFGMLADITALETNAIQAPTVRCYKHLDDQTHDTQNVADATALKRFVIESSRPVIGELLPHNHRRFLDRAWPMVYIFAATEAERSALRQSLKPMARGHYESLTMVTVDPLELPELQAKLGLDPGVFPAGAVHQLSKDRIFPYPKGRGLTSKELQSWGLDVWQGRVKPWTPPGVTTTYDNLGGRIRATQRVSMQNLKIPGVNIRVGGRDEL
ncbi:hypothetical protein HD806DRAFT_543172 [Xylariaceae sp. AK1471]|nr:hypothetical protein HD806DRAFT_543172 [Xylariaceae sp. AK1471]